LFLPSHMAITVLYFIILAPYYVRLRHVSRHHTPVRPHYVRQRFADWAATLAIPYAAPRPFPLNAALRQPCHRFILPIRLFSLHCRWRQRWLSHCGYATMAPLLPIHIIRRHYVTASF
jgi:hypothetical protein